MKPIIAQGAEANIFLDKKNNSIIKKRIKKSYRHPELDKKLRKKRTKAEIKILEKASKIIFVPKIKKSELEKNEIELEYLGGQKLSEKLNSFSKQNQIEILKNIGNLVSILHKNNIIHADLTTSNMILSKNKIYFIDFGLSYISRKLEDKAVDLHLLKQALVAKHFKHQKELWKSFTKGYKYPDARKILERLKAVEKRGRYKKGG